eukprot:scaffold1684_cov214-Amphora_coffeaeformis.AAC.13
MDTLFLLLGATRSGSFTKTWVFHWRLLLSRQNELAEYVPPDTTAKLHEQIKKRLHKLPRGGKGGATMGAAILDRISSPDYIPVDRNVMAAKFGTLADSHGFFYALQALKQWGYVVFCDDAEIAELSRRFPVVPDETHDKATKKEMETKQEVSIKKEVVVKQGDDASTNLKKRASMSDDENEGEVEDEAAETMGPTKGKKKQKVEQSKRNKKRSGGKPLKLSETAAVNVYRSIDHPMINRSMYSHATACVTTITVAAVAVSTATGVGAAGAASTVGATHAAYALMTTVSVVMPVSTRLAATLVSNAVPNQMQISTQAICVKGIGCPMTPRQVFSIGLAVQLSMTVVVSITG